jgi:hypothetical protein
LRRYLETFFRSPWLYLLPLALVLAGSSLLARRAVSNARPFTAEATIAVNLDPTRERSVAEQPIAEQHAALLGELLESDSFILGALQEVSPEASLALLDEPGLANAVRARWAQAAVGPNTFKVKFSCVEPAFCVTVVAKVLDTYRDQVAAASAAKDGTAVEYYQRQLESAEERLRAIPPTDPGYPAARETYEELLRRLIDAGFEEAQAAQARQRGFTVLSPPQIAGEPSSPLREAILPIGLGLVVGLGLSLGAVALATWLDHSVRTPADVFERLGLQTVAAVPPDGVPSAPFGDIQARPIRRVPDGAARRRNPSHAGAQGGSPLAVTGRARGESELRS